MTNQNKFRAILRIVAIKEALLSVADIIAYNARLTLIVLGVLMMLIGWAFGAGWIIALGFFFLVVSIVTKESRAELARSPIH